MLGAINAVNPLYAIGRGAVDAYFAIEEGDYRKAGKIGVQAAIMAGVAIYGTAKGAPAPAAGAEAGAAGAAARGGLPKNPGDLLKQGYKETSHPRAAERGHRSFRNPETGDVLRFDKGRPSAPGHAGKDHYHRENPHKTCTGDACLDRFGHPTPKGSDASHLYPDE